MECPNLGTVALAIGLAVLAGGCGDDVTGPGNGAIQVMLTGCGGRALPYTSEVVSCEASRYFSFHPTLDTLAFTNGGLIEEIWLVEDFDHVIGGLK